jgi:hypothetical protein
VFKQIWDEGRFIEDELAVEYFGGLLASARPPDGKDDRILPFLCVYLCAGFCEIIDPHNSIFWEEPLVTTCKYRASISALWLWEQDVAGSNPAARPFIAV